MCVCVRALMCSGMMCVYVIAWVYVCDQNNIATDMARLLCVCVLAQCNYVLVCVRARIV